MTAFIFGVVGIWPSEANASYSPSGCIGVANDAHASNYHKGHIGYRVDVNCSVTVAAITIEIWGDRSSWTGWRQHTDSHLTKTKANRWSYRLSQHQVGMSGTYDYRTRGKVWSEEPTGTYYANLSGDRIKNIECTTWLGDFICFD